jgi:putative flippase GtrA
VISRQAFLFLVAGGIAAGVNFLSRIALSGLMPYAAAIVVAYILGMITAFVLNRTLVFTQANNRLHHQVLWFTAINIAAVLQTLVISLLLARIVLPRAEIDWHNETVAHAIGVCVPVITSYLGHKHFTFRYS